MFSDKKARELFDRVIESLGDDPNRNGLKDTFRRAVQSYTSILDGYRRNPQELFKTFDSDYAGTTVFRDVAFYSLCEHHLLPMFGYVDIGIITSSENMQVIGFNKIPRLVDVFAHRLQIQERLTKQITDCLEELLRPEGVIVLTRARHLCAEMRGVRRMGHHVACCDQRGAFSESDRRREFLAGTSQSSI